MKFSIKKFTSGVVRSLASTLMSASQTRSVDDASALMPEVVRRYVRPKPRPPIQFSSQRQDWETPQSLFDQLHEEFNFTLDAAADEDNHKLPNYFTEEQDALSQVWTGRPFVNPPFGRDLPAFVRKAAESVRNGDAELVVMILPARTETAYWQDYIFKYATEIRLVRGRVKYVKPGSGRLEGETPSTFGTAIILFDGRREKGSGLTVKPVTQDDLAGKGDLGATSSQRYVRSERSSKPMPFDPKRTWNVVQADNIEFLKSLKPESVQCFVLDPPYNVKFKYNTFKDDMPHEAYIHQQLMMLRYATNALKPGGSIFYLNYPEKASEVWAGATFLDRFKQFTWTYNTQCVSIPLRKGTRTWLWFSKGQPLVNKEAFLGEYISIDNKRVQEKMANGEKPQHHDWLHTPQVNNMNRERRGFHPCQYPQVFAERFILGTTNKGDLVGDVYLGSGTTAVASIKLGRRFTGCDMDPFYVSEVEKELRKLETESLVVPEEVVSVSGTEAIASSEGEAPEVHHQAAAPEEGFEGFVTGKQLMRNRVESPQLLIENYFSQSGVGVLAGETGSRKSFIAMDAAYAVATGTKFLGRFQAMQGGVLYCNFELSQVVMQSRNDAFCRFRGLKEIPKNLEFFNRLVTPFDLARPEDAALLEQKLAELRPKFLVFDTFKRGTSISGNNDRAVTKLFSYLVGLGERFGIYTLIVDHTNKAGRDVAGAYGKLSNAAIGFIVNKVDENSSSLRVVKPPTGWQLHPEANKLLISVTEEGVTAVSSSQEMLSPTEGNAQEGSSRQRKDAKGREVILSALAMGEKSRQELLPICMAGKVSAHRMRRLLDELVAEKAVAMSVRQTARRGGADHVYTQIEKGGLK